MKVQSTCKLVAIAVLCLAASTFNNLRAQGYLGCPSTNAGVLYDSGNPDSGCQVYSNGNWVASICQTVNCNDTLDCASDSCTTGTCPGPTCHEGYPICWPQSGQYMGQCGTQGSTSCPGCMNSKANCYCSVTSPIIIDLQGVGFHFTNPESGTVFKIQGPNKPAIKVSWPDPKFGNAWLALDRNGNGIIDDASELFGTWTPQPKGPKNGFNALSQYDENHDGVIDDKDPIYSQLLVWVDSNYDGISQKDELFHIADVGIASISLSYTFSKKTDQWDNTFNLKGSITNIRPADVDKTIYDVNVAWPQAKQK